MAADTGGHGGSSASAYGLRRAAMGDDDAAEATPPPAESRSPRPPPPSPPPPPPPPSQPTTLAVTLRAEGSVSDFDDKKIATVRSEFAKAAGVEEWKVTVSVYAGSVLLHISVYEPDPVAAKAVATKLATQMVNPAPLATLLNITVEATPVMEVGGDAVVLDELISPPPPPPPPPVSTRGGAIISTEAAQSAGGGSDGDGLALYLGVAGGVLLALIIGGAIFYMRRRRRRQPSVSTRNWQTQSAKSSSPASPRYKTHIPLMEKGTPRLMEGHGAAPPDYPGPTI